MHSPSNSFSASFDAIAPDADTAPSAAVIDAALSACAAPQQPGFYLLDDADGRFVVDCDFGVVSLKSEAILEAERDAVHVARLLVIEHSGARYELALRLKLTGIVPQAVIAEEPAPIRDSPLPPMAWTAFRACKSGALNDLFQSEQAPFGALLTWSSTPQTGLRADLSLPAAPPRPAARDALWAI